MSLPQEGKLSEVRYTIAFSPEYMQLHNETIEQMKDSLWDLLASRGREFPVVVESASNVDVKNASAADIGALVRYFAYRGKSMEDINLNFKYKLKS